MSGAIRKSLIIILLSLMNFVTEAQSDMLFSLRRHPWKCNNALLDSVLKRYPDTDSIYFRIPLTVWVYPDKKGFGPGFNEVKKFVHELNYYFVQVNHVGVSFYLAQINVMPTQKHQTVGYTFENFFMTLSNRTPGTINIHLVNKIWLNTLLTKKELGGVYNSFTRSIILTRSDLPTGLAHEMGHYFGLLHPHRNWNKGKAKAESVSRTMIVDSKGHRNCECRGDYLCDTPAEPDLSLFMDDSCNYIGSLTDPWGEPYKPLTDNIMSYQPNKKCRHHFTHYQRAVILLSLEQSRYYKFWRTGPGNISLTPDKYEPDDFIQIPSLLEPFVRQYHTFHLIYTARYLVEDYRDFYKFYLIGTGKTFLSIKRGKHIFPAMKIVLYDNFYNEIYSVEIFEPTVIELPNVSSPVCYIKIESLKPLKYGELFDYNIELQEF